MKEERKEGGSMKEGRKKEMRGRTEEGNATERKEEGGN